MTDLLLAYLFLTIFNIWHIFEEIDGEIWKALGKTRRTYLLACVAITGFILVTGYLLAINHPLGFVLRYVTAIFACLQFIHVIAWIKLRNTRGTFAAGILSTPPLVICGLIVLLI